MFYPSSRQSEILTSVRLRGSCSIAQLASQLDVSEESIRRDVRPLTNEGLLIRSHGRVEAPELYRETPFQNRMREYQEEKQRIATYTASVVNDGDSLIIDTGTTTSFVARALSEHSNLVVVTNSIDIAHVLAGRNGNRVYMAGGKLRDEDGASLGPSAVSFVEQFAVQHAILSMKAINVEHGLMDTYLDEAEFSRAVLKRAKHITVVADHSKFTTTSFVTVCEFDSIDTLITTAQPPQALFKNLQASNVKVVVR